MPPASARRGSLLGTRQRKHSAERIAEMRQRYANGQKVSRIARELDVSHNVVVYYVRHATVLAQRRSKRAAKGIGRRGVSCPRCGKPGHYQKTCDPTDVLPSDPD